MKIYLYVILAMLPILCMGMNDNPEKTSVRNGSVQGAALPKSTLVQGTGLKRATSDGTRVLKPIITTKPIPTSPEEPSLSARHVSPKLLQQITPESTSPGLKSRMNEILGRLPPSPTNTKYENLNPRTIRQRIREILDGTKKDATEQSQSPVARTLQFEEEPLSSKPPVLLPEEMPQVYVPPTLYGAPITYYGPPVIYYPWDLWEIYFPLEYNGDWDCPWDED